MAEVDANLESWPLLGIYLSHLVTDLDDLTTALLLLAAQCTRCSC